MFVNGKGDKIMTIKELREQLERIEKLGYGNHKVIFIDSFDITHDFETGIHDIIEMTEEVVLG